MYIHYMYVEAAELKAKGAVKGYLGPSQRPGQAWPRLARPCQAKLARSANGKGPLNKNTYVQIHIYIYIYHIYMNAEICVYIYVLRMLMRTHMWLCISFLLVSYRD